MGHSLTGIADDASAVYFNPAGLVFNDENTWHAEVYTYYAPTKFKYTANNITDESDEIFIIPGFFISKTYNIWAFGLGLYVPYAGGGTAYDNFQGLSYDFESFAGWAALTPAVSYKLRPNLSIGAGVSIYYGSMENESFNPDLGAFMKSEYDGVGGYGAHIGLMYKPTDQWNIGLTARSEVSIEMDGEVKFDGTKFDSDVELTFPYSFILGFGYKPDYNLTFSLSFNYRLYGDMDEITFKTAGVKVRNKTYYENCWLIGLGMEYRMKNNLIVRLGLKYDQAVPENKGLNPSSNDIDLLTPSIGFAYPVTQFTEISLSGLAAFGFEKEYNEAKYEQDLLSFTIGFRFKFS